MSPDSPETPPIDDDPVPDALAIVSQIKTSGEEAFRAEFERNREAR